MSHQLTNLLNAQTLAPPLPASEAAALTTEVLAPLTGLEIAPRSIAAAQGAIFCFGRRGTEKLVAAISRAGESDPGLTGERETTELNGESLRVTLAPLSAENAEAMRGKLPYLVAVPLGLQKSAGCGDRLGIATPGHIRAFRTTFGPHPESKMAPILTQQSIRENDRTGRTPQEVMDDAVWGVFQEGWREGFGADADHLKTPADVDVCAAAGYTFYTIDPGDHVDDSANEAPLSLLEEKAAALPWDVLASSPADLVSRLADQAIDLGEFSVTLSRTDVLRSAAKYGRPVAHTVEMVRHLAQVMPDRPYEVEMSVDETETVTSLAEHIYIATELRRLGVQCVSLAPRYVGTFEKGVDYIGDLAVFEESFKQHFAVSQAFGPYKLSLHSGSDKFSVYPIATRIAGSLVHLKTAGTSYLEALRAIAQLKPALFREIVAFAIERYPTDRASYHVSAEIAKMPAAPSLPDDRLSGLLDDFHAREILHVTFGSVLNHPPFRARFFDTLYANEETYHQIIETHFNKHFERFL